jgi:outer membrane protein
MMFPTLLIVAVIGAAAGPAPQDAGQAGASRDGVERLTLEDAIGRGLANSQRLAELQARREGAEAAEEGRQAAARPLVAIMGGYTRTNHVDEFGITVPGLPPRIIYPDIPDNLRARLDLQWPVYTGGRTDALERAARAEREAAGEDLAAARSDLRLEVTRAFWALVTARETEEVVARSLQSMDAHVGDLRSRLEQGLIPPNDVLSAEAQQSRARLLAIEAGNTRAVAEADLRRLLAIDGEGTIEPQATLVAAGAASAPAAGLIEQARKERPERRALEDRAEGFEARGAAAA